MKLPIQLRALKETDILECITLFQNTIHAVNAKDYLPIQLEAWAPKVKPEITPRWQTLSENISYVVELVIRALSEILFAKSILFVVPAPSITTPVIAPIAIFAILQWGNCQAELNYRCQIRKNL